MSSEPNRISMHAQALNLARRWSVQNENDLLQVSGTSFQIVVFCRQSETITHFCHRLTLIFVLATLNRRTCSVCDLGL